MSIDRNSAAVVCNAHTVPRQKCYFDVVRESAHRLIARVVKDFPDEVMKAGGPRRPNVHARASTHCFQPFKNCNVFSSVPGSECWRRLFVDFFLSHGSCNDKIKKRYFRGSRAPPPRGGRPHPPPPGGERTPPRRGGGPPALFLLFSTVFLNLLILGSLVCLSYVDLPLHQ